MVVLAAKDPLWPKLGSANGKPVRTAIGGSERGDSVLAGLRALPDSVAETDFVLVHDAARPCVRYEDLGRLIAAGTPAGGAPLAAPLRDTLKSSAEKGRSIAAGPRPARRRAPSPA